MTTSKKSSSPKKTMAGSSSLVRLQKVLSQAGIASRRQGERMIREGMVTVNGKTIRELGTKVNPLKDRVEVDGVRIRPLKKTTTVILNKPRGYLCAMSDPENRPLVTDLVKKPRVYPVGRLDFNTEGLLLLTNDGDLAYRLTRTANQIPKTYLVKVSGIVNPQAIGKLRRGIRLEDGMTAPAEVAVVKKTRGANTWLSITLIEGRNRQIHRMLQAVGHLVSKIKRIQFGALELSDLPLGQYRVLSEQEIQSLKK